MHVAGVLTTYWTLALLNPCMLAGRITDEH